MSRTLLAVLAITLLTAVAAAHVAPSVDDNNRYLKLTPLGDRVRLSYTVFFGEVPGAGERRTVDANHDGQISDAEGHAYAEKLAAEVAATLEVEIDGHGQPVRWSIVDAGMGTPTTSAGSFSVDMVAWLCLPTLRGKHRIALRDRFRIPHPGETEVKVEDSPGVTIDTARVGPADDPSYDYKFVGAGGPLSDEGLTLAFTAGDRATVTADGACEAGKPARRTAVPPFVYVGVPLVIVAGLAFVLLRRRTKAA